MNSILNVIVILMIYTLGVGLTLLIVAGVIWIAWQGFLQKRQSNHFARTLNQIDKGVAEQIQATALVIQDLRKRVELLEAVSKVIKLNAIKKEEVTQE